MKNKIKRFVCLVIFPMFFSGMAYSQEIITGLQVNQQVKQKALQIKSANTASDPLLLPFFEDFSQASVFPDPAKWSDEDAFISDDYAVYPPTIGVATLDAINNVGRLHVNASPFPFMADYLTSQQIRLDSLFSPVPRPFTKADSIYFSFYYQPQGNGNAPARSDSLVLEFLAPGETQTLVFPVDTVINGVDTIVNDTVVIEGWRKAWSSPGQSLSSFYHEDSTWFRQVVVPVADSAMFYTSEFRFRFRNYASLASSILPDWQSNGDQWNIDYVYLNSGRNLFDTLHRDVAFASRAPQMLKNFTSMPYNQYRANFVNEMSDTLSLRITNLDSEDYLASYRYEVSRENNTPIYNYSGGNYFVAPYATSGYVTHQPFANPPVNFKFPIGTQEKIFFTTTHILNTEATIGRKQNDTIRNVQLFANYLSYDDGTAEAGYGLTPQGAQLAYRFKLNSPDSLLSVQMYFNQTLNGGNVKSFYLNIWNDYFGEPGDLVYSKFGYEPAWGDSLNQFFTYKLDSTIRIQAGNFPNLTFYVGWEQTSGDNLNLGYDKNSDASANMFYRTFGGWNQSLYKGAVMIRPILGKEKVVGLQENQAVQSMRIYPNPTYDGQVLVQLPDGWVSSRMRTTVYNATGMRLIDKPFSREEDFGNFSSGMYIIQVAAPDGTIAGRTKLLIYR